MEHSVKGKGLGGLKVEKWGGWEARKLESRKAWRPRGWGNRKLLREEMVDGGIDRRAEGIEYREWMIDMDYVL